jgi:hypothetical protein
METLGNFVSAFESLGYQVCETADYEAGFEKVALFVNPQNIPKHAARSLANGAWTSKLGDMEDIEHPTLTSIEGLAYGKAVAFLRREI